MNDPRWTGSKYTAQNYKPPISNMSDTPISSTKSKKRELTSPEFIIDLKKNRVSESQSEAESDISDLSISENMEPTGATGSDVGNVGDTSAQVTLSDTHLERIAALMQASFQPQLVEIVQESFRSQVTDLINSIVQGVLAGLQTKVGVLETENAALKNRVDKLEASLESAEQYSRRNCLKISGPGCSKLTTSLVNVSLNFQT